MSNRSTVILVVVVAIAAAGITRYYFPKVEYRNVEVTKEVVKTDIRTVTHTVERPDGTKETTSETVDHSTRRETTRNETIIASKPQWMFDVSARAIVPDRTTYYDLQVQRRIVGPFFLGVKASTDHSVGVSLGMEF